MTDIFLYQGEITSSDIKLSDPTILRGGSAVNYTLTCAAGAYTYTGQAATLTIGRGLVCDAGAYTYSGQAATLTRGYSLPCATGAYTYVGNAATLDYVPGATAVDYVLTCDTGVYSYVGVNAELTYVSGEPQVVRSSGGSMKTYHWAPEPTIKKKKPKYSEPELVKIIIKSAESDSKEAEKALRKLKREAELIEDVGLAITRFSNAFAAAKRAMEIKYDSIEQQKRLQKIKKEIEEDQDMIMLLLLDAF